MAQQKNPSLKCFSTIGHGSSLIIAIHNKLCAAPMKLSRVLAFLSIILRKKYTSLNQETGITKVTSLYLQIKLLITQNPLT